MFALCAPAQVVVVDLVNRQNEFLPKEELLIGVRIANKSGRELHFGRDNTWLSIDVQSLDERKVGILKEMPVTGKFTVESPMRVVKLFDIAPYFDMVKSGRYYITATVRIREGNWQESITSSPIPINIVRGITVWEREFGVIDKTAERGIPEVRKYALQKANLFNNKMKMYLQLTSREDPDVFKVVAIDNVTNFSKREAQLDKYNYLHVLLQTPRAIARDYNYSVFGDDGRLVLRRTYNADASRPFLRPGNDGLIRVQGGVRRISRSDLPKIDPKPQSAELRGAPPAPDPSGPPTVETTQKSGK